MNTTIPKHSGTRLRETRPGSFVFEIEGALADALCREMIRRFEANPEQQYPGRVGQAEALAQEIKRSTDLRISGRKDWRDVDQALMRSLADAFGEIGALFPFFAANRFKDVGYNMQRTLPGEYYHWHVDGGPGAFSQRQLVALWYLNDVEGPGGETEFLAQDVKVTPAEGKLILFPPFWTHVHRGVTLAKGVKYIATTWICFS